MPIIPLRRGKLATWRAYRMKNGWEEPAKIFVRPYCTSSPLRQIAASVLSEDNPAQKPIGEECGKEGDNDCGNPLANPVCPVVFSLIHRSSPADMTLPGDDAKRSRA
jgi:hypothetical protein